MILHIIHYVNLTIPFTPIKILKIHINNTTIIVQKHLNNFTSE